jgi:hypothetical protein
MDVHFENEVRYTKWRQENIAERSRWGQIQLTEEEAVAIYEKMYGEHCSPKRKVGGLARKNSVLSILLCNGMKTKNLK